MEPFDLLIIGNGFDLACGLKTSYADFHNAMIEAINYDIRNKQPNPFERFPEINLADDKVIKFIEQCKKLYNEKNFFVSYFCNCLDSFEWNRVEIEIGKIVRSYDYILSRLMAPLEYKEKLYIDSKEINDCLSTFIYVREYNNFHFEINPKNGGADILVMIRDELYGNEIINLDKIKESLIQHLFDDLQYFSNLFAMYLKAFCDNDKIDLSCKFNLNAYNVISYNYTHTIEYYNVCAQQNIRYIHGDLGNNNLVFGPKPIDFNNSSFNIFSKPALCLYHNTDYIRFSDFLKNINNMNNNMKIGFFGHSLDLADAFTLRTILNDNDKDNTVYIFYKDANAKRNLISNLVQLLGRDEFQSRTSNDKLKFLKLEDA